MHFKKISYLQTTVIMVKMKSLEDPRKIFLSKNSYLKQLNESYSLARTSPTNIGSGYQFAEPKDNQWLPDTSHYMSIFQVYAAVSIGEGTSACDYNRPIKVPVLWPVQQRKSC